MKLYGFAPTRTLRVQWMLQELDLDFEYVVVDPRKDEHHGAAYLALNPAGKLPALVDGDLVLTESVAIVLYLAEKYPEKGLLPADVRARGEVYRWLFFTATELEQPVWRIALHTNQYSVDRRIPAEIANARQDFLKMAAVMEKHLEKRSVLVGETATVADFIATYTLDMASMLNLIDTFPNLRAYVDRMYSRPKAAPSIREAFASLSASG